MARNHEVTTKHDLLKPDGTLAEPGWSKSLIQTYNRESIAAPKFKIKEWDYYLIMNEDIAVALTVNDMSSNLKKFFLKKDNIVSMKNYQLKLKDAKEVAAIFEALNSINIPDVDIARCAVSPELEQEVKNRLLVAAAQKAKENATILAEAVGSKAGDALFIQNYYNFSQPATAKVMSRGALYATAANEEADALPALEVTKTTISINVTCHFALLP